MTVVALLGSKGGVGVSLVATCLGVALAGMAETLLVDLNGPEACDDMLLDLPGDRGWQDLLPVAEEFTDEHIKRIVRRHRSGLGLLASRGEFQPESPSRIQALVRNLRALERWLVLDLNARVPRWWQAASQAADAILLVTTPDLPALRASERLKPHLPAVRKTLGLVVNQVTDKHPASVLAIARSLELPLAAAIRKDPWGAAARVRLGGVADSELTSGLEDGGRSLSGWLAERLSQQSSYRIWSA